MATVRKSISKPKVVPKTFPTYLSMIEGSVGSRAYRKLWALRDGALTDIARDGDLSCGFFVSFLLVGFGHLTTPHATVSGVVRDLEQSGWKKIARPRAGAVIVWGPKEGKSGEEHAHIGFWMDERRAISNSSTACAPRVHHPTYGTARGLPCRPIIAVYWKRGMEKE